ncbi:MAG: hypothetical protein IT422_07945 [Pirellulaceae bacterium]|jgi:hypothetical protein|nr:hypothetical protein [Pirellulaceae bacterium]
MHTIRLREPWQCEWTRAANPTDTTRIARYHRYFHRPSGLLDQQPVTLTLVSTRLVTSAAQLRHGSELDNDSVFLPRQIILCALLLNSQPLQLEEQTSHSNTSSQLSVRIDSALEPYNLLEIDCEFPASEPAMLDGSISPEAPPALADWAEVRIEIDD